MLIVGDNDYNNLAKFNAVMDTLYEQIPQVKTIATFGGRYGAEVLGRLYAEDKQTDFK
jgi:hypothetical protein